jgi:sortase (surface protein transpeptidase)
LILIAVPAAVAILVGGATAAVVGEHSDAEPATTRLPPVAASTTVPIPSARPSPAAKVAPSLGSQAASLDSANDVAGLVPLQVSIPVLHVNANVVPVGVQSNGGLAVPDDVQHVAWYRNSPLLGQPGTSILAAHVDLNGSLGIFHDLPLLRPHDIVRVTDAAGATHTFTVVAGRLAPKSDPTAIAALTSATRSGRPMLALVTCGGTVDYAKHSYRDNYIVLAEG